MVDGIYCKGEISCWLEKKKNQYINFCSFPFSYFQLVLWLESWSVCSGNKSMLIYDIRIFLFLFQVPNQKDLLLLCVLLPLKYIFFLSWTVTGSWESGQMYLHIFRAVCVSVSYLYISTARVLKALLWGTFPFQVLCEEKKSPFLQAKAFNGLETVVLKNSNFESIVTSIIS